MQNAVYAITALRWQGADIEQAMVGLLDVERMQWDLKPAPLRTCTVIDRLLEGDTVIALVDQPAAQTRREPRERMQLGPGLQVALSADGAETFATADERDEILRALPRF